MYAGIGVATPIPVGHRWFDRWVLCLMAPAQIARSLAVPSQDQGDFLPNETVNIGLDVIIA